MRPEADIVVVGAGIIGLAIAYNLAKKDKNSAEYWRGAILEMALQQGTENTSERTIC